MSINIKICGAFEIAVVERNSHYHNDDFSDDFGDDFYDDFGDQGVKCA